MWTEKNMSRLSLIIAFPSFWFSGFAALNFDSFKGEKTSAWSGLCLQICLSLPHTCFYFIPVTQSSHLFLSHLFFFLLSLWTSARGTLKAQDLCSQGLCQVLQQLWLLWTPHLKRNSLHPWAEASFKHAKFSQHSDVISLYRASVIFFFL